MYNIKKKYKFKYINLKNMLGGVNIDIDIEKAMYVNVGGIPPFKVYIPEEDLVANVNIKELFRKYDIDINENINVELLLAFSKENKEKYKNSDDPILKYTHIANLAKLFKGAKDILNKYLPNDAENYDDNSKWFRRSNEILRRIFSHNYEKRLVDDNPIEYNTIKFPERILLVKDLQNNKLSKNETINFIDTYFKMYLDYNGEIFFDFDIETYQTHRIFNYTTYIEEHESKQPPSLEINHEAYNQIISLCNKLGAVDYTSNNVHYENGIVYIKDLKNKGQNRCPQPIIIQEQEKDTNMWWLNFVQK